MLNECPKRCATEIFQRSHHKLNDDVRLAAAGDKKISQRLYVEALDAMRSLLLNACALCQQALVAELSVRNNWPCDRVAQLVLLEDRLRRARTHKEH